MEELLVFPHTAASWRQNGKKLRDGQYFTPSTSTEEMRKGPAKQKHTTDPRVTKLNTFRRSNFDVRIQVFSVREEVGSLTVRTQRRAIASCPLLRDSPR